MLWRSAVAVCVKMSGPKRQKIAHSDIEECGLSANRKVLGSGDALVLRRELLAWWDRPGNRRAMPWRRIAPVSVRERQEWAYGVWVSEIMLQQTQYERVKSYWQSWMEKWPTVEKLAAATIDEVQAQWTGLGYYRRARFLLDGAKIIGSTDNIPTTRDGWLKVKGVGPYTAAAVSSVCFNEKVPLVDGNVIRVLSRLCGLADEKKASKVYWNLAGQLVDDTCDRPGDVNQAIMELGATVCLKSSNPSCSSCPYKSLCVVASDPKTYPPLNFPPADKKQPTKLIKLVVTVAQRLSDSRIALLQLPEGTSLLEAAGMWHLPTKTDDDSDNTMDFSLLDDTHNNKIRVTAENKPITHSITNKKYQIHVDFLLVDDINNTEPIINEQHNTALLAWVAEADLKTKGSSSIVQKAIKVVKQDCDAFIFSSS